MSLKPSLMQCPLLYPLVYIIMDRAVGPLQRNGTAKSWEIYQNHFVNNSSGMFMIVIKTTDKHTNITVQCTLRRITLTNYKRIFTLIHK